MLKIGELKRWKKILERKNERKKNKEKKKKPWNIYDEKEGKP